MEWWRERERLKCVWNPTLSRVAGSVFTWNMFRATCKAVTLIRSSLNFSYSLVSLLWLIISFPGSTRSSWWGMHVTPHVHHQEGCFSFGACCHGNLISNLCGYWVKAGCRGNRKFDFITSSFFYLFNLRFIHALLDNTFNFVTVACGWGRWSVMRETEKTANGREGGREAL